MKYEIKLQDPSINSSRIELGVIVEFEEGFRYGFKLTEDVVGLTIIQTRRKLSEFLGTLVEFEIIPCLDQWGRRDTWLSLQKRAPVGFRFIRSRLKGQSLKPNEPRIRTPYQVKSLFHYPPVWIERNLFKEGQISREAMEELLIKKELPGSKIGISVSRDGEFRFDFKKYGPASLQPYFIAELEEHRKINQWFENEIKPVESFRVKIINVFLALMYSRNIIRHRGVRMMRCESSTLRDADALEGGGTSGPADADFGMVEARKIDFGDPVAVINNRRIIGRNVFFPIRLKAVREACTLLDSILEDQTEGPALVEQISMWHDALIDYQRNDYSSSLRHAWFVTESLISTMWEGHLEEHERQLRDPKAPEGMKFMRKDRRKRLKRMGMETIIDLLAMAEKIPDHLLRETNSVRERRNKAVHHFKNTSIEATQARLAIALAEEYFHLARGLRLKSGFKPYREAPHWDTELREFD